MRPPRCAIGKTGIFPSLHHLNKKAQAAVAHEEMVLRLVPLEYYRKDTKNRLRSCAV